MITFNISFNRFNASSIWTKLKQISLLRFEKKNKNRFIYTKPELLFSYATNRTKKMKNMIRTSNSLITNQPFLSTRTGNIQGTRCAAQFSSWVCFASRIFCLCLACVDPQVVLLFDSHDFACAHFRWCPELESWQLAQQTWPDSENNNLVQTLCITVKNLPQWLFHQFLFHPLLSQPNWNWIAARTGQKLHCRSS